MPEQQFSTLIPWMMEKYGKKVYTIAADYNFGQISAEWMRKIVKEKGGTMVGEEFIPLGVSQFSQTIQNIQKAKPDWLVTLLVGAAQASFYEQAAAANLELPMASLGQRRPGLRAQALQAAGAEGHVRHGELRSRKSTRPRADDFKKRWHAKFPNESYINQGPPTPTIAIYLYKAAASRRRARPIRPRSASVLGSGDVCIDGPEGKVCIDPKSQHTSPPDLPDRTSTRITRSTSPRSGMTSSPTGSVEVGCDLTKKRSEGAVHAEQPAQEVESPEADRDGIAGPAASRRSRASPADCRAR